MDGAIGVEWNGTRSEGEKGSASVNVSGKNTIMLNNSIRSISDYLHSEEKVIQWK